MVVEGDGSMPIEVQTDEGDHVEEHRPMIDADPPCRHLAYVEADFESMRRGGSCRTATCLCGWKGPQRGTLELAADDALTHEQSTFCVAETVQGSATRRAAAPRPKS